MVAESTSRVHPKQSPNFLNMDSLHRWSSTPLNLTQQGRGEHPREPPSISQQRRRESWFCSKLHIPENALFLLPKQKTSTPSSHRKGTCGQAPTHRRNSPTVLSFLAHPRSISIAHKPEMKSFLPFLDHPRSHIDPRNLTF